MRKSPSAFGMIAAMALLVGCSRKQEMSTTGSAASGTTSEKTTPHAHGTSAAPAWTADHDHKAPHGGRVHTAGDGHIEVKIVQGEASVWILDHDLHVVSGKGVTATIRVRDEDPVAMTFDASSDGFTAKVKGTSSGQQLETNVELVDAAGKKSSARFFLTPE